MCAQGADLIILSETAQPVPGGENNVVWFGIDGPGPGLGVIVRNGYTLSAHAKNAIAPALFGAFRVSGPQSLNLLAAWPVKSPRWPRSSYSHLLQTSLAIFGDFLADENVAVLGDLNSSSRVKSQCSSHLEFVKKAAALGLTSLYHNQTKEAHGQEKLATYRHLGAAENGFHLDYCFLSQALLATETIRILQGCDWEARSDHFPIIVDLA